ncbi:hypothetical protein HDU97_001514 [Phlyctochytrium planicorne]|nr:hypothetical protein HDU97_001514 [Phlyctochytrium planicorne]
MKFTAAVSALVLALSSVASADFASTSNPAVKVSAVASASAVQITVSGPLKAGSYIGFGFGSQMAGAELVVISTNDKNMVSLLYSKQSTPHVFDPIVPPTGDFILSPNSTYASGTITATFSRPLSAVSTAATDYILAYGNMNNGVPTTHSSHELIKSATLISGSTATASVNANGSASGKPNSASIVKGAAVAGVVGAVAALMI